MVDDTDSPYTMEELNTALARGRKDTVPGADLITYSMLRNMGSHAKDSTSSVYVVVGEHDYTTLAETTIIMHPNYNTNTYDNDMTLIKLSSPLTFPSDNKVAPVCLPDAGNTYSDVTATVTGWGTLQSETRDSSIA
ncbi:chymotrypsin-like protease CTRL-1 [Palaemon carinicauda]|uniref:chymotrypsin-like protease CTRL-1 n=1 Tax=Palaemon carinicauda TaxID=392227 RepID=UPI0035B5F81B